MAANPGRRPPSRSGSRTPQSFDSPGKHSETSSLLGSDATTARQIDFITPTTGQGQSGQRSYGTTEDGAARTAAFASLPARLTRSHSVARKLERIERKRKRWSSLKMRLTYYVPVLAWLPEYTPRAFIGDVTAAFTMTSLIVPQSMSYSTNLVHSDPVCGLFGAALPAMIYSVLGTCRQLSIGPEAALSLIMGEAVARFIDSETHAHGHLSDAAKMTITMTVTSIITFQAGLITFLLGMLRLGFLDAVLSRALLRGFITAVGFVIFASQLIPILGLEHLVNKTHPPDSFVEKIAFVAEHIDKSHRLTVAVSLVALAVLILAKLFKVRLAQRKGFAFLSYVPEVLGVVIFSTVFSAAFKWHDVGLDVLGKLDVGDVKFRLPFNHLSRVGEYSTKCLSTSAVIAVLGFLDSIVGAKDAASKFDYPISPNRELVAIGASNLFASVWSGTLPGYGSITRSRLAGATGATTQMASLLTGTFVLLVTFFLLGLLAALPKCILAVIILVVVFSILEEAPHDIKFFFRMHAWVDCALMSLTFLLSLFVSVEVGIVVSIALSMVLCIKQAAVTRIKILGRVPGTSFYEPVDDDDDDGLFPTEEIPGILIVRFRDASLNFANAGALKERLRRLERYGKGRHHPSEQPRRAEASVLIFHCADIEDIDASALQLIYELVESYTSRSVLIYWAHVQPEPLARLGKAGVIEKSGGENHVQPNVQLALQVLNESVLATQTV